MSFAREALGAQRFLGLDLAGAKNAKTTLAILESYPKEKKTFLLDVHDQILPEDGKNADQTLLDHIHAAIPAKATLGTSAPLVFPPAIACSCKRCPPGDCRSSAARWATQFLKKLPKRSRSSELPRLREYTPYTQRPVEVWARYEVLPRLPARASFEVDETLGGNKAPLAARMVYLKRFLKGAECVEVWPKLSAWAIGRRLGLPLRVLAGYRSLDEGTHAREEFLEALAKRESVFLYDKDARKLIHGLSAFDAFLCAYTAMLSKSGCTLPCPKGFPEASGWVEIPGPFEDEA